MKMRLGKYVSVLITTLLVYFAAWIIFGVANSQITTQDVSAGIGWTSFISLIVLCCFFVSSILGITWYSIKIMFRFYKEKSLWKILTLCFGVGMILFSFVIIGFGIQWVVEAIPSIFRAFRFNHGFSLDYNQIWQSFIRLTNSAQTNSIHFASYITIFVFIVLWSFAGIAYEIIKKLLGGNRRRQSNSVPN